MPTVMQHSRSQEIGNRSIWSNDSVLSHVEVRYAGSTAGPNNGNSVGAIEINASPSLDHVRIIDSNHLGSILIREALRLKRL